MKLSVKTKKFCSIGPWSGWRCDSVVGMSWTRLVKGICEPVCTWFKSYVTVLRRDVAELKNVVLCSGVVSAMVWRRSVKLSFDLASFSAFETSPFDGDSDCRLPIRLPNSSSVSLKYFEILWKCLNPLRIGHSRSLFLFIECFLYAV